MTIKVGDKFQTKNGICVVVDYVNSKNVTVEFLETGYITTTRSEHLREGKVKDYLYPSVFGIGFIGTGEYSLKSHESIYYTWCRMLSRCYYDKFQETNPTYIGCDVCNEWHNFQRFAKWHDENHPKDCNKYQLDKDLKILGNKIYSPEACLFVCSKVNSFANDNGRARGEFAIGVSWNNKGKIFHSTCSNPFTGAVEHIGYFELELDAHMAWRKRKSELAEQLANQQENQEVKDALLRWKCALDNNLIHKY